MFAALEIKQSEQGILAVMKNRMLKIPVNVRRIQIMGSNPFVVVSVVSNTKRIPWNVVVGKIGRLSNRMLLPNDVTPPSNSGVKVLDLTADLPAKMLLSTAIDFSKYLSTPSRHQKITVIDRTGIYLDQIERLIKTVSVVRVVTDMKKQYENVSKEIFSNWGASISVLSNMRSELKSDIIISPFEQVINSEALVLSTDKCKVMTPKTIISPQITLPEEYRKFLPCGVDEHNFACALFDDCGLKKLADRSYDTMLFKGSFQSIQKIAKILEYHTL